MRKLLFVGRSRPCWLFMDAREMTAAPADGEPARRRKAGRRKLRKQAPRRAGRRARRGRRGRGTGVAAREDSRRRGAAALGNRDDGAEARHRRPCEGCTSLCRTPCRGFTTSDCAGAGAVRRVVQLHSSREPTATKRSGRASTRGARGGTDAGDAATLSTAADAGPMAKMLPRPCWLRSHRRLWRGRSRCAEASTDGGTDVSVAAATLPRAIFKDGSSVTPSPTRSSPSACYKFCTIGLHRRSVGAA